jgi:hypothetical protein
LLILSLRLKNLVIVDNLNIFGPLGGPDETDAPLVVGANRMLTGTICFNASSRLAGGELRSFRSDAAFI